MYIHAWSGWHHLKAESTPFRRGPIRAHLAHALTRPWGMPHRRRTTQTAPASGSPRSAASEGGTARSGAQLATASQPARPTQPTLQAPQPGAQAAIARLQGLVQDIEELVGLVPAEALSTVGKHVALLAAPARAADSGESPLLPR